MYTSKKKGQATIEYIVLVAVAIIIALVIFGFLGWIPGMAGTLRERQARIYWSTSWPVAIKDFKITSSGATFLMENLKDDPVKLYNITVELTDGTTVTSSFSPSGYKLTQGEAKVFIASNIICTAGQDFELTNVSIVYDSINGISNQIQTSVGERPIIGKCPG